MKRKLVVLLFSFLLALLIGCTDPTPSELEEARNLDIYSIKGEVVAMRIERFAGDRDHTRDLQGKPYYCLDIEVEYSSGTISTKEFRGVSVHTFGSVEINKKLPIKTLNMKELKNLSGRIVDMQRNLEARKWYIAVESDDDGKITIHSVTRKAFYRLDNNMILPGSL